MVTFTELAARRHELVRVGWRRKQIVVIVPVQLPMF
jgi:hypothetical protein